MSSLDEYTYDVFISYRQQEPDKSWVRKTLVPALETAKLKVCIDYRDFHLGAPVVKEMERGVVQSRYTLAVLSPAYLKSNFTDFEQVLATQLGLEKTQRRLLAILREECDPGLALHARLWLDMTDNNEFQTNMARLIYELHQPSDI